MWPLNLNNIAKCCWTLCSDQLQEGDAMFMNSNPGVLRQSLWWLHHRWPRRQFLRVLWVGAREKRPAQSCNDLPVVSEWASEWASGASAEGLWMWIKVQLSLMVSAALFTKSGAIDSLLVLSLHCTNRRFFFLPPQCLWGVCAILTRLAWGTKRNSASEVNTPVLKCNRRVKKIFC